MLYSYLTKMNQNLVKPIQQILKIVNILSAFEIVLFNDPHIIEGTINKVECDYKEYPSNVRSY